MNQIFSVGSLFGPLKEDSVCFTYRRLGVKIPLVKRLVFKAETLFKEQYRAGLD